MDVTAPAFGHGKKGDLEDNRGPDILIQRVQVRKSNVFGVQILILPFGQASLFFHFPKTKKKISYLVGLHESIYACNILGRGFHSYEVL